MISKIFIIEVKLSERDEPISKELLQEITLAGLIQYGLQPIKVDLHDTFQGDINRPSEVES